METLVRALLLVSASATAALPPRAAVADDDHSIWFLALLLKCVLIDRSAGFFVVVWPRRLAATTIPNWSKPF
jgi:hypothetical protein